MLWSSDGAGMMMLLDTFNISYFKVGSIDVQDVKRGM